MILPGFENAVAEQERSAAKVRAEELTRQINTPANIKQAAGAIETLSPLFRGTEASPQKELFKGENHGRQS